MTQIKKLNWFNKGGSSIVKTYKRVWDAEKCRFVVVETGEYNIADKIQASSNVSDLALFYKQLNAGLVPPPAGLGDDTIIGTDEILPRNIHEFKSKVNEAYKSFGKLPAELQNIFGNDEALYLSSLADGSYAAKIADYVKSQKPAAAVEGEKE